MRIICTPSKEAIIIFIRNFNIGIFIRSLHCNGLKKYIVSYILGCADTALPFRYNLRRIGVAEEPHV